MDRTKVKNLLTAAYRLIICFFKVIGRFTTFAEIGTQESNEWFVLGSIIIKNEVIFVNFISINDYKYTF